MAILDATPSPAVDAMSPLVYTFTGAAVTIDATAGARCFDVSAFGGFGGDIGSSFANIVGGDSGDIGGKVDVPAGQSATVVVGGAGHKGTAGGGDGKGDVPPTSADRARQAAPLGSTRR